MGHQALKDGTPIKILEDVGLYRCCRSQCLSVTLSLVGNEHQYVVSPSTFLPSITTGLATVLFLLTGSARTAERRPTVG